MVITQHQASRLVDNGRWVSLGADHGICVWETPGSLPQAPLASMFSMLPLGGVLLARPKTGTLLALPFHEVTALDEVDLLVKANHHASGADGNEELWFYDGELHRVEVEHQGEEILVHPPSAMFMAMARLHALRRVAVEA